MTVVTVPEAPTVALSNGVEMPRIALGTWPMDDAEAAFRVTQALCIGYRHVDTAENYGNETGVGEAIRKSGVPREKIFVTTKFNREWHSVAGVRSACEASLKRLNLDYIDLFLVHWPNPSQDRYVEAFQGLVEVQKAGLVRSIGVSNFKPAHLQRLFDKGLVPQVNQIHLDPYHRRDDLDAIHRARGIVTECWSPVGRAGAILSDPSIVAIARELGRTPGQVILRWHVEHGYVPAPKSSDPVRQAENLDIFGFGLTPDQMKALDCLDRHDPEMLDSDVFGH